MEFMNLKEIVDAALLDGIVEAECTKCGMGLQCEPDATTAWCDNCDKIVKVKNPLIINGFI